MNSFVEKVKLLVEHLARENKSFDFFGLVKLIDLETPEWEGGFDVVVLAKWLPKEKYEAIGTIVNYLYNILDVDERRYLGNIVILSKYEGFIKEILKASQNNTEIKDKIINGLSIREAIILEPKQKTEVKVVSSETINRLKDIVKIFSKLDAKSIEMLKTLSELEGNKLIVSLGQIDSLVEMQSNNSIIGNTKEQDYYANNVIYGDFSQGNKEYVRSRRAS
jgi:hypothetical protein